MGSRNFLNKKVLQNSAEPAIGIKWRDLLAYPSSNVHNPVVFRYAWRTAVFSRVKHEFLSHFLSFFIYSFTLSDLRGFMASLHLQEQGSWKTALYIPYISPIFHSTLVPFSLIHNHIIPPFDTNAIDHFSWISR